MSRAEDLKAPFGDGATVTNGRYFTCDSTSRVNALPAEWSGKWIRIRNLTANNADWFLSTSGSATCDETVAATDAGASSVSMGDTIFGNTTEQVQLPYWRPEQTMYFVRASVTTTTLKLFEASN
jgi:hypothetical protein